MVKIFNNNNLHIKTEQKSVGLFAHAFEKICTECDFMPIGEQYCVGNFDMAIDVMWNGGTNYYRLLFSEIEKYNNGETIILKSHSKKYIKELLEHID